MEVVYSDIVVSFLEKLSNDDSSSFGQRDLSNFSAVLRNFPSISPDLLRGFFVDNIICLVLLTGLVEKWTVIALEEVEPAVVNTSSSTSGTGETRY